MKKFLLTLVLLVGMFFGAFAQKLTYQAVIRDNNQQLVVNTPVKATVTITFSTGNPYSEEVNGSTNNHGLLSFEFGGDALNGRDWTDATIAVKVVKASDESVVYVNDDARPVSAVPYALSVNGQSIQNYLTEHNYVDLDKLKDTLNAYPTTAVMDGRHYLRSDSAVITTMQSDIAGLKAGQFDCNKVKDCIKDTLGQYTPTTDLCNVLKDCQFSEQTLAELLQGLTNQISDLKEQVDSLSRLPHGGDTPTEVADGQPCPGAAKVKDVDGNEYNTVKIGSQCWTMENMKTTKYANSNSIDNSKMFNPGDSEGNVEIYGKLYTWSAATRDSSTTYPEAGQVTVQGICPTGWHVPSNAEWTQLTDYVKSKTEYQCGGNSSYIANALSDATGWKYLVECGAGHGSTTLNKTSFSAVPAGRCVSGRLIDLGSYAFFWSATQSGNSYAMSRDLSYDNLLVNSSSDTKDFGYSVRCLKDAETGGTTPSTPATVSCDKVMECMGDTLGRLNAKIEDLNTTVTAQGQTITTQGQEIETLNNTVQSQGQTIDSLAHIVDSLSNLTPGGGDTTEVADGQPCPGAQTVKDVDNNEYPTVKIGSQCWMAQNLRTKLGTDGDNGYPKYPYGHEKEGQMVDDSLLYGRLYTWTAMMKDEISSNNVPSGVRGICPEGWHVPSDAEWDTLTTYVKGKTKYRCGVTDNDIANALSGGTWIDPIECTAGYSGSATFNTTGFSAVPAGYCFFDNFSAFGSDAYFWSATQDEDGSVWCRYLRSSGFGVARDSYKEDNGFSVRCLRDAGIGGTTPSTPATMSCEDVMRCMGDTLGRLNAKIEAQGEDIATLNTTVTTQGQTIDSLAHIVDSLSNLTPGGGDTPTEVADGQPCPGAQTVTDVDNNEYPTVKIGSQCWMAQNLRTKIGGDGDKGYPTGAGNDTVTYGRLYSWTAMMNGANSSNNVPSSVQGICPTGWHVPSDAEWDTLTRYVFSIEAYKCGDDCGEWQAQNNVSCIDNALSDTTGWQSPNPCCAGHSSVTLNKTGFSAVPAGRCFPSGFGGFGYYAYFWSATQSGDDDAWYRYLSGGASNVDRTNDTKVLGFSVRCLRDAGVGGGDEPETPGGDTPTAFTCGTSKVKDVDNNEYNTVKIGSQCWTKENLRTTKYADNTNIDGSKMFNPYNKADSVAKYGKLYTWDAATGGQSPTIPIVGPVVVAQGDQPTINPATEQVVQGICPEGWHVPNNEEWDILTTYVNSKEEYQCDGDSNIANALSAATGWTYTSNCCAGHNNPTLNATGFSAVPADEYFSGMPGPGYNAYFWSADGVGGGCYRWLNKDNTQLRSNNTTIEHAYSVRCLRDEPVEDGGRADGSATLR